MILFFITLSCFSAFALSNGDRPIDWYRAEARAILRRAECGRCHIPPGNDKALKIYDLNQENWADRMSDGQVGQIKWRIDWSNEDLEKSGKKKFLLSKKEIKFLHDFVDKEIAYRKANQGTVDWLKNLGH
jgi:hypothetical protein